MSEPDRERLAKLFVPLGAELAPDEYTKEDVEAALEPVAGDPIIMTLSGPGQEQYISMTILEAELEDIGDVLRSRVAKEVAARYVKAAEGDVNWLAQNATEFQLFVNEQEACDFFEKQARFQMLHSDFWYNVRHLAGRWNDMLSVRKGYNVVAVGKKFKAN